ADRLSGQLGVAWPKQFSTVEGEVEAFLTPSLRHHASRDTSVLAHPHLSPWIRSSFEILARWCRNDIRVGDTDELDTIRAAFDAAVPAFDRPVTAGQSAILTVRKLSSERARLSELLEKRDAENK